MRITNTSMVKNHMYDLQQNLQRKDALNTKLNTGKQVNKLSDDPHKAIKIMNMQSEIKNVEKYNYNIDEVVGWMNNTDASLEEIGNVASDIKEILMKVGNGTYGPNEMSALKAEVNEKIKQLGEVLNTTHGGKYIFGGTNTDEPPVKVTEKDGKVIIELNPNSNKDDLKTEISDGIKLDYNTTAENLLNSGGKNFLDTLNSISEEFSKDPIDKEELTGNLMKDITSFANNVLDNRTELGAKVNIAEAIKESNEDNIITMKGILSVDQDVDYSSAYIELKSAEMIYAASVQVGSKLMTPTILDYLR